MDDERPVLWMPAIPAALVTFLVGSIVLSAGLVVVAVALVTLVVRGYRRQWTALTYACIGSVFGGVVFIVFALIFIAIH